MDFTRPALVDPVKIFEAIENFGVTSMFGSPALLDRIGRHGVVAGRKLPTLRRVISAGAPVAPSVLERMSRMLPEGVEVFTPYGATEALPVCSIGSREVLAETAAATAAGCGVCVGKPVKGIDLAIIAIRDEPIVRWSDSLRLPPGQIGEVAVRGSVVTREYHNREEATRLAKIPDEAGAIWHRMGDLGYLDERGRVWFCGRKSQRVESAGEIHYTILCEGVFNAHPQVHRTALVGAATGGNGPRPVLCVELEEGARTRERERIRSELLELGSRHPHTRDLETILFHPAFPVDIRHNAKIFREKLAAWAASRLS